MSKKRSKPAAFRPAASRPVVPPPAFRPATQSATQSATNQPATSPPATPQTVVAAIEVALDAVRELTARRAGEKLSITRLTGVTRELRDIQKVMSIYGA